MAKAFPPLREQYRAIAEKRAAKMARLREQGLSYAKIGAQFGLTRQRAFQIVTEYQQQNATQSAA